MGTGEHTEIEQLTMVALYYAAKAYDDTLNSIRADGFTASQQASYIAAMTGVHFLQLHLLRVKENGNRELALRHRQIIADLVEASKKWL